MKTTKEIRKELAILISNKQKTCTTQKEKNRAVELARQEINTKYGKGWREQEFVVSKNKSEVLTEEDFFLLDSRAGTSAVLNDGILEDEDPGRYILTVGTLKECCKDANTSTYGEHCVVSDNKFNILWEIYTPSGHWSSKLYKEKHGMDK